MPRGAQGLCRLQGGKLTRRTERGDAPRPQCSSSGFMFRVTSVSLFCRACEVCVLSDLSHATVIAWRVLCVLSPAPFASRRGKPSARAHYGAHRLRVRCQLRGVSAVRVSRTLKFGKSRRDSDTLALRIHLLKSIFDTQTHLPSSLDC